MTASLRRIWLIAANTGTEILRQRVYHVLLLFGLLIVGGASFFSQFTFDEQAKFIKDFSLGAMTLTGTLMGVVVVAQMLPAEIESRTLFTVLSKPVLRHEFLLGKFFGASALLVFSVLLMGVVLGGVLHAQERSLLADLDAETTRQRSEENLDESKLTQVRAKILAQTRDPQLALAVGLVSLRLVLVAGIALLISTFSTSIAFTVVATGMVYILGHLLQPAREIWLDPASHAGWIERTFVQAASFVLPDFQVFKIVDEIASGSQTIGWSHGAGVAAYVICYTVVLLLGACSIFSTKEL